jgi:hypothetical protein
MKKLLQIILLPALFLAFNTNKLKAAKKEKDIVTVEIVNNSPYEIKWVKFFMETRKKLTVKRDFVIGKKDTLTGMVPEYYKKYIPSSPDDIVTVKLPAKYVDSVIKSLKMNFQKDFPKTDERKKFPCGIIMQKNSVVRITISRDNISTCIRGDLQND